MNVSRSELEKSNGKLRRIMDLDDKVLRLNGEIRQMRPYTTKERDQIEKLSKKIQRCEREKEKIRSEMVEYKFLYVQSREEMKAAQELIRSKSLGLILIVPDKRTRIADVLPENQEWRTEGNPCVQGVVNYDETEDDAGAAEDYPFEYDK